MGARTAVSTKFTKVSGSITFQAVSVIWSILYLGRVQWSQRTKRKSSATFKTNQTKGDSGPKKNSGSTKPKKGMFIGGPSAQKENHRYGRQRKHLHIPHHQGKETNFMPPYSTVKPVTNSASAS
jgi:hypothetical protein